MAVAAIVAAMWALLILVPGALWMAGASRRGMSAIAGVLVAGALHDLVLLLALSLLPVGLQLGAWIWGSSLTVPLFVAWRGRRRWQLRLDRPAATALVLAVLLGVWVASNQRSHDLGSDAPAHLGGIRDALNADRFQPPDRSVDNETTHSDPRFGVAHGVYAALSSALDLDPSAVLASSSVFWCPVWFLAHAWLFHALGLGIWPSLLASLLFTLAGSSGRAFGTWSATYPGNQALALAALAVGQVVDSLRQHGSSARLGAWLLGATVLIHPFAWFGWLVALAHAVLLWFLVRQHRPWVLPLLGAMAWSMGVGTLLMLPRLLARGAASGLHYQVTDAMFLGGSWFIADPLVVTWWGGTTALLALPVALILWRPLRNERGALLAVGAALTVWTISWNPVVEPVAWRAVSYLSVRLLRLTYPPLFWIGGLILAWRLRHAYGQRVGAIVVATACSLMLFEEATMSWAMLRENRPHRWDDAWEVFGEMAEQLPPVGDEKVWTDPRTSYGLRALRGGPMPTYPVAHASPRDDALPERLAAYRELFDVGRPWAQRIAGLSSGILLLNLELQELYGGSEWGFVPDVSAHRALDTALRAAGASARAQGRTWSMYDVGELARLGVVSEPRPEAELQGRLEPPIQGPGFDIVGIHPLPPTTLVPGDTARVRVWYQAQAGGPEDPFAAQSWSQVHVRLEGPTPRAPAWATGFDKLYRKFFQERKGRSATRFGRGWIPFDGVRPPHRWAGEVVSEVRSIPVPTYIRPGKYVMQPTTQPTAWRANRHWRDYLRNADRFAGPGVVEFTVEVGQ